MLSGAGQSGAMILVVICGMKELASRTIHFVHPPSVSQLKEAQVKVNVLQLDIRLEGDESKIYRQGMSEKLCLGFVTPEENFYNI